MKYKLLICLMKIVTTYGITCDDILELPEGKKLSLSELQTTQPKYIVECLAHLGKEKLAQPEAEFIWQSIAAFYNGIACIPENVLMLLHWVTPAISPEEYSNITFNSVDVIQNFGLNYNLEPDQLAALADRIREDFAGKEPEDYTYYDLTALRQILCAFNRSEIERIHPSAYREAALIIGKLERCSSDVMAGFATLAVKEDAFGSPDTWNDATKNALGKVAEFMSPEILRKKNINSAT